MALFQSRFTFGPFVIEGAVPGAFFGLSSKQNTDQMFTFSQPVVEINGQERTDFKFSYVLAQRTHPRGWEDFETPISPCA